LDDSAYSNRSSNRDKGPFTIDAAGQPIVQKMKKKKKKVKKAVLENGVVEENKIV
jgi:hypothetical protein